MKKILSCTGFEPMTSAVLVQFSTNWANPKVWGLIPHRYSEFFLCPMFMTRWKNTSFSIYLLSSKFTISLNSFYKHYTFHIANPSSMQDACHNRPRSQWSLCGSLVIEHRSTESKGLRFDSSKWLWIFSLYHARDKAKYIFIFI